MDDLQTMLAHETPLRAAEAARRCGVSVGALVRWMRKGKLINGQRRQLEGYAVGRSWMTTVEALARFIRCDPRRPEPPQRAEAGPRRKSEGVRRLEAILAKMGV